MGGKNQDAANTSWQELSRTPSVPAPTQTQSSKSCKKPPKHWIGVRVEDEEHKLVKDVVIHAAIEGAEYGLDMATAALDRDGVHKTKEIFVATECEFWFPDLYDVDWWPSGETKPATFPAERTVTIADGGCVVSAAKAAGFRDYHELWDCAANTNVKQSCPNPNQQVPGGAYQGPDKRVKKEKKAVDRTWIFVVRNRKPAKLRLVLTGQTGKPLKDIDWELVKPAKTGKTGTDGMIEATDLKLLGQDAATLKVTIRPALTPPAAPQRPAATDPPAYPPPVFAPDFKDTVPDPDYTAQKVEWSLKIGALTAFNVQKGVLQRLQNLGFQCGADPGSNPAAEGELEAIQAYLRLFQPTTDPSGKTWSDIRDDIRDRHDKA